MVAVSLKKIFFKQKTAYEIQIRDWSSDVCSSDLDGVADDTAAIQAALDSGAVQVEIPTGLYRVTADRKSVV